MGEGGCAGMGEGAEMTVLRVAGEGAIVLIKGAAITDGAGVAGVQFSSYISARQYSARRRRIRAETHLESDSFRLVDTVQNSLDPLPRLTHQILLHMRLSQYHRSPLVRRLRLVRPIDQLVLSQELME